VRRFVVCAVASAVAVVACEKEKPATVDAATSTPSATASAMQSGVTTSSSDASTTAAREGGASPCPADMAYVDTDFCPDIERTCTDVEHEEPNHLTICHSFEKNKQRCKTKEEHRQYCIDRYEYPNQEGAHPAWMLTWFQAQATCESKQKRLCWSSEWTAACEGPEHSPFPYGWVRDHDTCNMDNFFIDPRKPAGGGNFLFYSKDPDVAKLELARLDQSVRSGSMKDCKSGFGVYDMPGNMDEWVTSDQPPEHKSKWAALKGGAWGHVRSQCRPMTVSHEPEFWYYFVSFRCCKDAEGTPVWQPPPGRGNTPPPAVEAHDFAPEPNEPVNPSGPSKTKYGLPRKH
jgi:sulfatase modifying factor 1